MPAPSLRDVKRPLAVLCAGVVLITTSGASADPQVSAGLTTGVGLTDLRAANGPRVAYHLGGRLDCLLLRSRANTMALGPYVSVATEAFDTFQGGGGVEWLLPIGEPVLVLSAGGFARTSRFGVNPGAEATLFFGSRSFNYHSAYGLGVGLFAQGRWGFGEGKQADAIFGAQVDLAYLAFPFIFAYEAVAH